MLFVILFTLNFTSYVDVCLVTFDNFSMSDDFHINFPEWANLITMLILVCIPHNDVCCGI
jgi:hypothetical protein